MSRSRRKPQPEPGFAHYAAPIAFLVFVTIAVLLVHSAFHGSSKPQAATTSTTFVVSTSKSTTDKQPVGPKKKRFYTVQSGDTFGSIAFKEGITVEQLQSLNPGVSSNALQVGQKLRVK